MDASHSSPFAEHLRALRINAGLSQEALALRSGLSLRGISDLERGVRKTPRLETVRMLADGLGLDADDRNALLASARPRRATGFSASPGSETLPRVLSPVIGREREMATIERLLLDDHAALVTLTGPGGVGKTTLAVAAAHAMAEEFPDGVTFVPLGPLIDSRLVVLSLGEALGLRQSSLPAMTDAVRMALLRKRALLVLDNFEHVAAAAVLVADIIATCPGVRVLVTSRERLRLRGEHVLLLEPLVMPDVLASSSVEAISAIPAVQVFLRRARELVPEFELDEDNLPAVVAICRSLDGLPLALELAASWMRILTPDELLARLGQRLPLLADSPRDAQHRHKTLQNAIEWSYQLLAPSEQRMFRWMGIFVGGFDLEAARAVLGREYQIGADPTVAVVAALVDKSLLRRIDDGAVPRFTLLETVREFALAKLDAAGERDQAEARHAAWYVGLCERMETHLLREVDSRWLDRLEVDYGNVRDALVWTLFTSPDAKAARMGLRLVRSLWLFWYYHSHLAEGRWWLERALVVAGDTRDADRAMALVGLGTLANAQGDEETALRCLTEGLALAREAGDPTVTAFALSVLGNLAEDSGHYDEAEGSFAEAKRIFASQGDTVNVAITLYHLGVVAFGQGRMDEAGQRCLDALALSRRMGDSWGIAVTLAQLGLVRVARGTLGLAAHDLDAALSLFAQIGSKERIADTLYRIAALASSCGYHHDALRTFTDAARVRTEVGAALSLPERAVYEDAERHAREALADDVVAIDPDRHHDAIVDDAHRLLLEIASRP